MKALRVSLFPFLDAAEPLRKRAPAVDENGKALTDFMVIIPGLKSKPQAVINKTMQDIQLVLTRYSHSVVFAEVNLRLNLLWVSIKPKSGMRFEITQALRDCIPEAKLVSHV